MTPRALALALALSALGCSSKEAAPPPPAQTATPAPPPAATPPAPSDPNPFPEAKPFTSAGARPRSVTGQLMHGGKLIDASTLGGWVVTSGCDGMTTGADMTLGANNKAYLDVHVRGSEYASAGNTYDIVKDGPVQVASWFEDGSGMTHATSGKVKVNQLKGGVDLEVIDADFGANGKVSAHLVTGPPLDPCKP